MQFDNNAELVFWGEAGKVGHKKMHSLVNRLRSTHLVFAKWDLNLEPFEQMLKKASGPITRAAPIDLISFPAGSDERFIHSDGTIEIDFKDVRRVRC